MEKVNKISTITRAFTTTSKISEENLLFRRDICGKCEFNSNNIQESELNFIGKARKKILDNEPFCTACGCQIKEKTSQETEECGLAEKDLTPKWFRLKLETTNRLDLNLINNSNTKVNVDLTANKKAYEINFGEVKNEDIEEIEFLLESKKGVTFNLIKFRPSCGSCTKANYVKIDSKTYKINVQLDTSKLVTGKFKKTIYLTYKLNNLERSNEIKLIGITK